MGNCGLDLPQENESDIADLNAGYPEVSEDFGPLHHIAFPYEQACEAIAACRDIAAMLRADLEERGDIEERGGASDSMVSTMTRDGAGGWREGNAETIGFDAAWFGQMASLEDVAASCESLAADVEDACIAVISENRLREDNRASHDDWRAFQAEHPGIEM